MLKKRIFRDWTKIFPILVFERVSIYWDFLLNYWRFDLNRNKATKLAKKNPLKLYFLLFHFNWNENNFPLLLCSLSACIAFNFLLPAWLSTTRNTREFFLFSWAPGTFVNVVFSDPIKMEMQKANKIVSDFYHTKTFGSIFYWQMLDLIWFYSTQMEIEMLRWKQKENVF